MAHKVYCNCCGKEFGTFDYFVAQPISFTAGYGSKYDGEGIKIDICADCLDKLIDSCEISPIIPTIGRGMGCGEGCMECSD